MTKLAGSITAIVTPFRNGEVDEKAFEKLVEWQIKEGSHGLVVCGTTGESPTLTYEEEDRLFEIAIRLAKGRVPIIAGTGSNDTAVAVERTQKAQQLGADYALLVSPYYNKPTQEGLYQHFKAIHDSTTIPIVLYNIPGRCVVDISPQTMARLAALPRIIGVKDATGDLARVQRTRQDCGEDFIQLSGNDDTAGAFLAMGGHGCISVASNLAPALYAAMQNAWRDGKRAEFENLRDRLDPLNRVLFIESNPAPVKYALSLLGLCSEELRLPLVPCLPATRQQVQEVIEKLGLLKAKAA
ncbi:MAG TPA: 4-hydroxy-tetrahydrodipicolinate synthase [Alphaproteobacteria bacterium]|nr:4-hydroxy-tetrahydrodipicolinate synthase [Alphaproteobacteria bacterium]